MSHFLGHNILMIKMFFFVFIVLFFIENQSTVIATGRLDLINSAELSSRDELVGWAGYGEDKLSTVEIGGKLLCHADQTSTDHPYPISGASVAVSCGTSGKSKKPSLIKGKTDKYGDFLIDLPSHLHAIPNLEKICRVKIVRLPRNSPCQKFLARRNHKRIELASIGDGIRSYTTNDIHLTMTHKRNAHEIIVEDNNM